MRWLVLAVVAAGCGKQLNPLYCAENPQDGDCRDAGLVALDAPAGCSVDTDCTLEPDKTVCDVESGYCVQCVPGVNTSACNATTGTVCGEDFRCHGCVVDADCQASFVCRSDGTCADEAMVLYAAPNGGGTDCSRAQPCTFTEAVAQLGTKSIIKLTTTAGTAYSDPPVTIAKNAQIVATGTTFTAGGAGDAITVTAGNVKIDGLTIAGVTGSGAVGVRCTGGELTLLRMVVQGANGDGAVTDGCKVTIERSRFIGNVGGAMSLANGELLVRNNIITGNGNTNLDDGNVTIANANGRFVFNTVAHNDSRSGNRTSGIQCAQQGTFRIARNIFASNGAANNATAGDCTLDGNFIGSADDVRFVSATDLHLTANTPAVNPIVRNDPQADADCKVDAQYISDIDGQARPYELCDRGADEYRP